MSSIDLLAHLEQGIQACGFILEENAKAKLIAYVEILHKWNAIHNLTAVRDPQDMIARHILDSLTVYSIFAEPEGAVKQVIDVGTGAGLPGIILAICLPSYSFVLLDSHQKKMHFVQHVILSLGLKNAVSVSTRVEHYRPDCLFDWVISRAFSSLAQFVKSSGHLCAKDGRLIAMKGRVSEREYSALPAEYIIERSYPIRMPQIGVDKSLLFIKRIKE